MTTLFHHLSYVLVVFFIFDVEVEGCSELSSWTGWGSCSRSCDSGSQTRSRTCCGWLNILWLCLGGQTTEQSTRSCNTQCCAVHGSWSSYGPWNNCPVTCGGTSNNQHRSRYCNKPQPSCGGSACSGTSKQYQTCNSAPCPVNGRWSEWSKFSACPVTCGGSTNSRTRACDNPTPGHGGNNCVGDSSESAVCNTLDCPDYCGSKPCENGASCANIHYGYKCTCVEGFQGTNCEIDIDDCVSVDCRHGGRCIDEVNAYSCECVPGYAGRHCEQVLVEGCTEQSGWTGWSSCTRSCNTGTKTRSRKCCDGWWGCSWTGGVTTEYSSSSCNTQCCAVHGSWSSYDPWNNCPVTCGGTTNNQYRSRYCNKPQPTCGGSSCSGTSKQYQICNSSPCPVDGEWSEWSSYGSCPVTCGSGAHSRYRSCNNPSPANGGSSCKGLDTEYTLCSSGECPVNGGWSEWSKFSACPVTCGGGTHTRTRACDNPTPAHGGHDCVGASSEHGDCNTQACPDYCGSNPCENWASCENIHYGYKCTCVEGFQGNNCEIDIDDCISVDCLHGGKCIDKVNAYSCECVSGYAGRHCEIGNNTN